MSCRSSEVVGQLRWIAEPGDLKAAGEVMKHNFLMLGQEVQLLRSMVVSVLAASTSKGHESPCLADAGPETWGARIAMLEQKFQEMEGAKLEARVSSVEAQLEGEIRSAVSSPRRAPAMKRSSLKPDQSLTQSEMGSRSQQLVAQAQSASQSSQDLVLHAHETTHKMIQVQKPLAQSPQPAPQLQQLASQPQALLGSPGATTRRSLSWEDEQTPTQPQVSSRVSVAPPQVPSTPQQKPESESAVNTPTTQNSHWRKLKLNLGHVPRDTGTTSSPRSIVPRQLKVESPRELRARTLSDSSSSGSMWKLRKPAGSAEARASSPLSLPQPLQRSTGN